MGQLSRYTPFVYLSRYNCLLGKIRKLRVVKNRLRNNRKQRKTDSDKSVKCNNRVLEYEHSVLFNCQRPGAQSTTRKHVRENVKKALAK